MEFTPPIQRGIFLTTEDTEFGEQMVVCAALRNPTDEDINLRNMDGNLFKPKLKQRTFTEEGTEDLWFGGGLAVQAITNRTIKAGKTVSRKWTIPNAEVAYRRATERVKEYEFFDQSDIPALVREECPVDPSRLGVVQVEVGFPAPSKHFDTLTRQYDLRHNADRKLDDEIPDGDEDAIESNL